jgi:hyperosmotically inducible protein
MTTPRFSCRIRPASAVIRIVLAVTAVQLSPGADPAASTFNAYVDSDLCSRLMLGPITEGRVECSKDTYQQGSNAVLVRLSDNLVLDADKDKLLKPLISQTVTATGQTNVKNGSIKLDSVAALPAGAIKPGSAEYKLLDVRSFKLTGDDAQVFEKVRHELAMLPYISVYDFISFTMLDGNVILTGWSVRQINRSDAYNVVKNLGGVKTVINNIEVLPLSPFDNQIRAGVRASMQGPLSRYFWGSGSDIKIVVKNGDVILLGVVASKGDKDLAFIKANGVRGAFKVFNMLQVQGGTTKAGI